MDESDVRQKIDEGMERQGFWVIHFQDGRKYPCQCPRCRKWHTLTVTPEVKGRPDLWGFHPSHPSALIEVKMIAKKDKLFSFSQIEEKQRDYLNDWVAAGGQA